MRERYIFSSPSKMSNSYFNTSLYFGCPLALLTLKQRLPVDFHCEELNMCSTHDRNITHVVQCGLSRETSAGQ